MNTKKNTIYLRRKTKVTINGGKSVASLEHLATLLKNIESLGYILSDELLEKVATLSISNLVQFYTTLVGDLKLMVGAHVEYNPMYPNFPQQVMDASDAELYWNAMFHYFGDWVGVRIMPQYDKKERPELDDKLELKVIGLGTEKDFKTIFLNLTSANTSISATDKEDIEWFVKEYGEALVGQIKNVPLRENISLIANILMEHDIDATDFLVKNVKTATDVLRLATSMSGGDVSLAAQTRFKNFKRAERRMLLGALESCNNITDDVIRYSERWKRLCERLHPFEYQKRFPNSCKAYSIILNKEPFETFGCKVEKALANWQIDSAMNLLKSRPGEYARRLDNMVRLSGAPQTVITTFEKIADKVSTPVLLQVKAHFAARSEKKDIRTFFPKGNISKVQAIDNILPRINPAYCESIVTICRDALKARFAEKDTLGKVYLDERIQGYFVPFSQRSASKSLKTAPRGSRYNLGEGDVVRFFIWWRDIADNYNGRVDLDLSAIGLDENHKEVIQVSYTNLRSIGMHHSGDITSAPDGASEFIDVSIEKCLKKGIRYMMMVVNSYTRQSFDTLPDCFAGAMMRQDAKSGEIYEPKTVDNKMDLTAETKICVPLIIDLKERQVIWTDMGLKHHLKAANNVINNMSSLQVTAKAMTTLKKPGLYDLFLMHAEARGTEIVDKIEEADTVFSIDKGITPFDADIIVSEYLA